MSLHEDQHDGQRGYSLLQGGRESKDRGDMHMRACRS
jgi:hypothetical protein